MEGRLPPAGKKKAATKSVETLLNGEGKNLDLPNNLTLGSLRSADYLP